MSDVPEPDDFMFDYKKDIFVSIQKGKVAIFKTDGQLISNFDE